MKYDGGFFIRINKAIIQMIILIFAPLNKNTY